MPLYELVAICRCSNVTSTAAAMRTISSRIMGEGYFLCYSGGNIRSIRVLGDRIMSKQVIGNDGFRHLIGRYISILYDGHPEQARYLQKEIKGSFEIFRLQNFRVKDFIAEACKFTKPIEDEAPFIQNKKLESYKYGRALEILREEKQKLS